MSKLEPDPEDEVERAVAADLRERKETEDLLAGFDRPARDPRRRSHGSFVSHYAGGRGAAEAPPLEPPPAAPEEAPTHVLASKRALPEWLVVLGAVAAIASIGLVAALVAMRSPPPAHANITTPAPHKPEIAPPGTPDAIDLPPPTVTAARAATAATATATATATTTTTATAAAAPPTPAAPSAAPKPKARPRNDVSRNFE